MAEEPHTNSTTINNTTPQSTSSLSSSSSLVASLESTYLRGIIIIKCQQMDVEYTFWQMLHLCTSPKVETDREAGTFEGVVDKQIYLKVFFSECPGMTKFTIALREIDTYKEVRRSQVIIALTRFNQHPVIPFVCTIYSLIDSVSKTRKNAIKNSADVAEAVDDAMKKSMDTAWSAGKQATKTVRDTMVSMVIMICSIKIGLIRLMDWWIWPSIEA
ncbi:hypothetical protein ACFE04_022287 [Oxalis oulophora]